MGLLFAGTFWLAITVLICCAIWHHIDAALSLHEQEEVTGITLFEQTKLHMYFLLSALYAVVAIIFTASFVAQVSSW